MGLNTFRFPSAREEKERRNQIAIRKQEEIEKRQNSQLSKLRDAIRAAPSIPFTYLGSLDKEVIEAIAGKGWAVDNTFKAHPHDGPGTQPTWSVGYPKGSS